MKYCESEILTLLEAFFPDLTGEETKLFFSICTYKVFNSKEIILKKGRTDKKFFVILKGSVRSYSIVDGNDLNCHLRSEGFIMGDARMFGENLESLLDTEAITDTHVLLFDMGELEKLALNNPKLMTFYLNILKEVIVVFSHRIFTFVTMNTTERYQDLMKWNPLYLKNTFDKHLASFLGISPLTFLRIKKKSIK